MTATAASVFGRSRQQQQQQKQRYPQRSRQQQLCWMSILRIGIVIGVLSCLPATTECFGAPSTPPPPTSFLTTTTTTMVVPAMRQSLVVVALRPHPQRFFAASVVVGHRNAVISVDNDNDNEETVTDGASSSSSSSSPTTTLGYVLKERNPYDVHVYYSTPEEQEAALELRHKLHDAFGDWMRFYPPKDRPIGPHPVPMWEADFGGYEHRDKFPSVCEFLQRENNFNNFDNHNSINKKLSILIHPHSLDSDYADHTEHAFWDGPVLPLRIGGWRR